MSRRTIVRRCNLFIVSQSIIALRYLKNLMRLIQCLHLYMEIKHQEWTEINFSVS
uniref:Uncharacterized protein n=1 Tax=Arundo donax TaxID=35708 RepID=A0A0A9GB26_ARUDO